MHAEKNAPNRLWSAIPLNDQHNEWRRAFTSTSHRMVAKGPQLQTSSLRLRSIVAEAIGCRRDRCGTLTIEEI